MMELKKMPKTVGCLACGLRTENTKEIEEFQANGCPSCTHYQRQREEKFLEMMDDFSEVIAKHFPNFDNNIEDSTWAFLVLFTEETIHQLSK
jgi:hypothetical protein